MRKCLRCNANLVEDLDIKIEGGAYGIKDGKQYKLQTKDLVKQAKLSNINYKSTKNEKKAIKGINIFLFYTIVSLTKIFILPTLGIIAPTFILCGIIVPIAGLIKLFEYIFRINIPFITFEIASFTLNPILGFILSILVGIILYLIGIYAWKLLLKYLNIITNKKKKTN